MKSILKRNNITFFLFFLFFSPSLAQDRLNTVEIERYLSTHTSLIRAEDKYNLDNNQKFTDSPSVIDSQKMTRTPITDSLEALKKHSGYEEFASIIIKAGFKSPEQWAATGDKIMIAYSAYQLKNPTTAGAPTIDEIKNNMVEDLEKIKNNKFISAEQKQILVTKIENSMAMLNDPNYIDGENLSIIGPYVRRLNSFYEEYQ